MREDETLSIERDGAIRIRHALDASMLADLDAVADAQPSERPGTRLLMLPGSAAPGGVIGRRVRSLLGQDARPVRAIVFDKSPVTNWSLGWHQDRTIALQSRKHVAGFGAWNVKSGIVHAEPPFAILEGMITVRVHLDDVSADNAPLLILRGSHRLGRLTDAAIDRVAADLPSHACYAERGDMWLYATPIVHASEAAARPSRRRVVQIDYASVDLPGGLEWLGVETAAHPLE